MNRYAINPQTGEVAEYDGQSWAPVEKSRVAKNANGDVQVYDGKDWQAISPNSPVAGPGQINGATPELHAYNPTFTERMRDLMTNQRMGTKAPTLPDNASLPNRMLDWFQSFSNATDAAARGVTGGLSDDAQALGAATGKALTGNAPEGFGAAYQTADKAANQNIANFKSDNPIFGNALETMGLVTSPIFRVGAAGQAAAPSIFGRTARAAMTGAGQGAIAGAGYSEGDLGNRAAAAGAGALTGGALSAALTPVIEGATGAAQGFYNTFQAQRAAANNPAAQARALLARAIQRDGMSPLPGQGEALAAAGGPNVQALARQSTVAPGNARAAAANYYEGAAGDMPDVIAQSAAQNVSQNRLLPTLEGLDRQQRAASAPAYDAFYAMSPDAFDTPYFQNLMQSDTGHTLIRDAYDLAELQRAAGRIPDNPMQYLLDAEGNVSTRQAPNARAIDMMKQAIDQQVASRTDSITGRIVGPMGHGWEQLRRAFLTNADRASTVNGTSLYQEARNAYAGPAGLKSAARLGSQAFTGNQLTSEKAQAFTDLSPAEQDAFRTGLAEAVIEKAGKMGANTDPVQTFLKGRNANDLMRLYLGNQASFDNFVRTLQQQSRIVKSARTVMGGSPTARIQADQASTLDDQLQIAQEVWRAATGGVGSKLGAAASFMRRMTDRAGNLQRGVNEPVANELGNMLFEPNPATNINLLRQLGSGQPGIFPPALSPANNLLQIQKQHRLGLFGPIAGGASGAAVGSNY